MIMSPLDATLPHSYYIISYKCCVAVPLFTPLTHISNTYKSAQKKSLADRSTHYIIIASSPSTKHPPIIGAYDPHCISYYYNKRAPIPIYVQAWDVPNKTRGFLYLGCII